MHNAPEFLHMFVRLHIPVPNRPNPRTNIPLTCIFTETRSWNTDPHPIIQCFFATFTGFGKLVRLNAKYREIINGGGMPCTRPAYLSAGVDYKCRRSEETQTYRAWDYSIPAVPDCATALQERPPQARVWQGVERNAEGVIPDTD